MVVHDVTVLNANVKPTRIRSRYKKYIYYIQQGHRPDLEQGRFSWYIGKKVYPERLREALRCVLLCKNHVSAEPSITQ